MDERRMTNEQRERERRRKAAAARKAAARYEDPGVGYQRRRRAKKRRRRVRNVCIALLVIFIVVIGLAGGTIYWIKYGPTKETYDLNKYFGITAKSQMGVRSTTRYWMLRQLQKAELHICLITLYRIISAIVFTGIPMSIYFCIHCREIW